MKHYLKKTAFISCIGIFGLFSGCSSSDGDQDGTGATVPTNLQVTAVIAGQDAGHPNGDGSGAVTFTATAENATTYNYIFPGGISEYSSTGVINHVFTQLETNVYIVTVKAYGANISDVTSKTITVTVYNAASLVWEDEFEIDGAPDPAKWGYDLGNNGWGNNEPQTYTTSPDNVIVEDGKLKITVKKDPITGEYTSTRMNTAGKFDFTYGKIVVKAKLPTGGGTWPAIWMLGANFNTAPWPACGEIDIMEHVGNNQNHVLSTLHYPGHFGGNGISGDTTIPTVSTEFHEYSLDWSPQTLNFYVDNVLHHSFANDPSVPFNHDFFIILNVAIGGNFGGAIDPAFTQSTMEVEYVRVYQ